MAHEVIDIFCHWAPSAYCQAALRMSERPLRMLERAAAMPVMTDLAERFRVMDAFPGYRQVPSLVSPPLECIASPQQSPDLARLANDLLAETAANHRDRFPGFVAVLPMNNPEAMLAEARRAVTELGASGVQVFTNVDGRPLDTPEVFPLFGLMAGLDRPIWLHPARGAASPDYPGETHSKFECWWALGWPYETSLAMYRLVFAGLFDRWPGVKVITHHGGGLIPMVEGRLGPGMAQYGTRTPEEWCEREHTPLQSPPLPAFRRFYTDTATFGSRAALTCALAFFGIDRMLFASDMPFDPEGGPGYIRATQQAVAELDITEDERRQIFSGNARALLSLHSEEA
ncbi:MAG: amidohydrolase family protein [Armatimonadota bacterium]